jgi:hypothetical protein
MLPGTHDRPCLDAPQARRRDHRGHLDGVVQIAGLDEHEPPSGSFVSAKGPSVVDTWPFRIRVVVAVYTGWRASDPASAR